MYRPFRYLTALLCSVLLVPTAQAAGLKVSLTERSQWPWPMTSPQAFDVASRAELAVFTEAMADADVRNDATGDAASLAKWKERMRQVVVGNFAKARETCAAGALFCEGAVPKDWDAMVTTARAGLAKLPAELAPWYAEQKPFHQGYVAELVRLAGLFPKVTSEILPLSPSERFGLEMPDRSFLLTFDDGPTPKGGGTDALAGQLRAQGIHAAFFLLGNNYEARRKATSVEQLRALYAGMCVGSHGQEHRSHASWAGAVAGMESFHSKLAETLPEGQTKLTLFRPPYGQRNPDILQALERGGMKNMLWNIDSQDWHASNSGTKAAGRVLSLMLLWRHGIILFHDIHPKAASALPRIWNETRGSGVSWVDCRSE
ncbi:MAG TPA: polysaccharide deacetylase family protein [Archangium sp.]|uniref:polysaccharide deacetylase family protein n=1 Tax=Archangium sp. TaxID=1872627 RepID=UPI002E322D82|nr:polysaccharide deacetylase family protein [Archangium sp.]HEX5751326.1 polysaccharide deacetylase family protein [Archangium sp.]